MTLLIDWAAEGIAARQQATPDQCKNWIPYIRACYADLLKATGQKRRVTTYRLFAKAFKQGN